MRVLVTGAEGPLGSRVVRLLASSPEVQVSAPVSLPAAAVMERLGVTPLPAPEGMPGALGRAVAGARPEAIVHAIPTLPPRQVKDAWIAETTEVVSAASEAGTRRLVCTSFVHAYGNLGWRIATEEHPISGRAPNLALQEAFNAVRDLEAAVLEHAASGPSSVVLRLGALYGPDVGSTQFLLRLLGRRVVVLPGGGRAVMSFVHADDAARAAVAALDFGGDGEVYNIVDDEPVSLRDYIVALADATRRRRPIPVPAFFGRLKALSALSGSIELRVSNEKARRDLRWTPAYPTYRQGLRELANGGP